MSQPPEKSPPDKTARLAAALRANLARRKAQTRARRDAAPPEPSGSDAAPGDDRPGGSGSDRGSV